MKIPFNKPSLHQNERKYLDEVLRSGELASGGIFTERCETFLKSYLSTHEVMLTRCGTSALEVAAILLDIQPGDEVIIPSFTYVTTANAFALRGAEIKFADCLPGAPIVDPESVKQLISDKTRAIVVMHYGGIACDMKAILAMARANNIPVLEDAALSFDAKFDGKHLGTLGDLGIYSFHATKNITSGEGGALCINHEKYIARAEVIMQRGTNRKDFLEGRAQRYEWVDLGSSVQPSELNAALLLGQLEALEEVQSRRKMLWNRYHEGLKSLADDKLFERPLYVSDVEHNAHVYFLALENESTRAELMEFLAKGGIQTVFHYQALHMSPFYLKDHERISLPNAEYWTSCLLRLPLYYDLQEGQVDYICKRIADFFYSKY